MAEKTDAKGFSEALYRAYQRRYPEEVQRLEDIGRIIDPGAYPDADAFDGTGPEARRINYADTPRMKYLRSVAQSKAHRILRYLGINEEVDMMQLIVEAENDDE